MLDDLAVEVPSTFEANQRLLFDKTEMSCESYDYASDIYTLPTVVFRFGGALWATYMFSPPSSSALGFVIFLLCFRDEARVRVIIFCPPVLFKLPREVINSSKFCQTFFSCEVQPSVVGDRTEM